MNVRFVFLFRRYDKPWTNRMVRSINLSLDWSLLEHSKSHIHIIDTTSFLR